MWIWLTVCLAEIFCTLNSDREVTCSSSLQKKMVWSKDLSKLNSEFNNEIYIHKQTNKQTNTGTLLYPTLTWTFQTSVSEIDQMWWGPWLFAWYKEIQIYWMLANTFILLKKKRIVNPGYKPPLPLLVTMCIGYMKYKSIFLYSSFNPFNPKLIMQILPTTWEENDWVM